MINKLTEKIKKTNAPIVVGLDPMLNYVPSQVQKKAFDELGVKKLPTVKSLQVEFAELLSAKKTAYADLKKVRDEMRELSIRKANYEELRDLEEREDRKEKERGRE